MRKLLISLSVFIIAFIGFSFASPSILTPSYTINGNDVKIYWTDNSDGGYVDINLKDPKTGYRLHFGEVKMSDQVFVYTKQWEGNQEVQMVPGDGGDVIQFTVEDSNPSATAVVEESPKVEGDATSTRTVITAVPKTGPSGTLVGIILASLIIFGGYIYIKKRADI